MNGMTTMCTDDYYDMSVRAVGKLATASNRLIEKVMIGRVPTLAEWAARNDVMMTATTVEMLTTDWARVVVKCAASDAQLKAVNEQLWIAGAVVKKEVNKLSSESHRQRHPPDKEDHELREEGGPRRVRHRGQGDPGGPGGEVSSRDQLIRRLRQGDNAEIRGRGSSVVMRQRSSDQLEGHACAWQLSGLPPGGHQVMRVSDDSGHRQSLSHQYCKHVSRGSSSVRSRAPGTVLSDEGASR